MEDIYIISGSLVAPLVEAQGSFYSLAIFSGGSIPTIYPAFFSTERVNRDLPPQESGLWVARNRELCFVEKSFDEANPPANIYAYLLTYTGRGVLADHRITSATESGLRCDPDPTRSHMLFSGYHDFYQLAQVHGLIRPSAKDLGQEVIVLFPSSRGHIVLSGAEPLGESPLPIIRHKGT